MLTITVVRFKDGPVGRPMAAEFRDEGGTIGRSPESTLLLPDPDRIISRTHAVVQRVGGKFVLRDQGTTVPVLVNGRPVGRGREYPLGPGDELRIAAYTMRVEVTRADIVADETITILREGAMLSWREDGGAVAQDRIATIIVPEPAVAEPPVAAPRAAAAAPLPQQAVPAPRAEPAPAEVTASDNNRLKFSPDLDAALAAVLARFDPAKLEARLLESSASGSLLAMSQKAKLWNLYEEFYGQISREAEADFHSLFGEEFLRAYGEKARPAAPHDAAPPPA